VHESPSVARLRLCSSLGPALFFKDDADMMSDEPYNKQCDCGVEMMSCGRDPIGWMRLGEGI
jgi:hypothetical protein